MRLYDKVFVPTEGFTNLTVKEMTPIGKRTSVLVERKDNKIVLSPEELREVWEAAESHYGDTSDFPMGDAKKKTPNFDQYLTSKGIAL